ncbi:penicillin-binding protein 1A [Thermodesulfobacteriota bacterium]
MKKFLKFFTWIMVVALVFFLATGAGLWYLWSSNLPYIGELKDYDPPIITEVYSEDGYVIGRFWTERRIIVSLDQVSKNLKNAFVAVEDDQFFTHKGVDFIGICRAVIKNQLAGRRKQGASTITQQVARLLLLKSQEKVYRRKVREIILAFQIEKTFTKERILFLYLNQIYLGSGAYGVEAAARTYFGKSALGLNLAECAMLGGIYSSPSRYSPLNNFELAKTRQKFALDQMLEEGFITEAQRKEALETEIVLDRDKENTFKKSPYFTEYIRRYIEKQYGRDLLYNGGLKIYTTMNLFMQQKAVSALQKGLRELDKREGYRGPLKSILPEEYEPIIMEVDEQLKLTPPAEGIIVKGIVEEVDDETERAVILVGSLKCLLPLENMIWARKPDPEVAHLYAKLKKISDAIEPGDLILCKLEKKVKDETGKEAEEEVEQEAENGVNEETEEPYRWIVSLEQEPIVQGALFAMENKTGKVRSMVGGYDFYISQFDRVNQARRQPGSAFKPIIYAAALDSGMTPSTVILDTPYVSSLNPEGDVYKPGNYSETFYGPTLFRTSLIKSRNVITTKILRKIGVNTVINYARRMGIESDLSPDLSLSLGSSGLSLKEMTSAYSVFANDGLLVEPFFIEKIEDREGRIIQENQTFLKEAIPEDTAYVMTDILKGVIQEGTGWRARALGRPAAGKTGTSNDLRDAWFIGYTPELVTGVWTGYDTMVPMGKNETGSRAASPIWLYFMEAVLKGEPVQDFIAPESVVFAKIDAEKGLLASPYSKKTVFQSFKKGTAPTEYTIKPEAPKSGNFSEFDMSFPEN